MSLEKRKEIASLGGKAAQERGTGRRWTVEEAKAAAKLGGEAYKKKMALLPHIEKTTTFVLCPACTAASAAEQVYHKPPVCE